MKKSLLGLLILCFTIGIATFAAAQDSATKKDDKSGGVTARGQAGDTKFDIQVQKDQGERGPAGERGPQGVPGPQGAAGPAGSTTVLGMDPTIALLVGLGVFAVVIVAIVAASRGRET